MYLWIDRRGYVPKRVATFVASRLKSLPWRSPQRAKEEDAAGAGVFRAIIRSERSQLRAIRMTAGALGPVHLALFATVAAVAIFRSVGALTRAVLTIHD